MRDYGVKTVLTSTDEIPLFYDEHAVVDRPFTLEMGESVQRGDLVYVAAQGADFDEPVAGEANTGNGTLEVVAVNGYWLTADDEIYTLTFDGTGWDVVGSESGAIVNDVDLSGGGSVSIDNRIFVQLTAGGTAFVNGDSFSVRVYKTGSGGAWKATQQSHVTNTDYVVLIAGRDTDATDGPEPTFGYVRGVFNKNAIGNWDTLVTSAGEEWEMIGSLQKVGIDVKEGLK